MKQSEIIEGNCLIAYSPFASDNTKLTIDHYTDSGNDIGLDDYITNLKYHESWDALMSVVEKIENLEENIEVQIGKNIFSRPQQRYSCIIHNDGDAICFEEEYANEPKLNGVWRMVVVFIQWHNSNSKVEKVIK